MVNDTLCEVQVCYMTPELEFYQSLRVSDDSTIQEVLELSDLRQTFPVINIAALKVGIYSKIKSLDTLIKPGDRIEVYRPLLVDPMVARRRRAVKKTASG